MNDKSNQMKKRYYCCMILLGLGIAMMGSKGRE